MKTCEECGTAFEPSSHGKEQRYCSSKCRLKAWRRTKRGDDGSPTPTKKQFPRAATRRKPKTTPKQETAELTESEFTAMFDGAQNEEEPYEVLLRRTQGVLKKAMFDKRTPPASLSALSKRLLDVSKELRSIEQATSGDLVSGDDDDGEDEEFSTEAI